YLAISGPNDLADRQILAVSPYALTIKRSADALFVWAVDLATGKPVNDLPLQVSSIFMENKQDATVYSSSAPRELGRTDAEGILQAPFASVQSYDPVFLWSGAGKAFAFGTTNWGEGINPWDFGLPADYEKRQIAGNVTTDRPIYRSEQNVYI